MKLQQDTARNGRQSALEWRRAVAKNLPEPNELDRKAHTSLRRLMHQAWALQAILFQPGILRICLPAGSIQIMTASLFRIHDEDLACFELAGCALHDGLAEVRAFYQNGMPCNPHALPMMPGHEQMADFVHTRVTALMSWLDDIAHVVNSGLPQAMQAPARAEAVLAVCDGIILFGRRLAAWEQDVAAHQPPAHWRRVMTLLRGMTRPLAQSLFQQAEGIAGLAARVRAGETNVDPRVNVPSLPQLALLAEELPRAWEAGAPFHERHPILTALFLRALLSR